MAAKRSDAYETFTHDLLQLADSRGDRGLTHVAMESAGVYWSRCGTFSGSSFRCCSRTRNPSTPRPGGRRTGRELRDLTRYRAFGAEDELLSRIGFRKFSRAPTPTWRQLATDALGASGERSWKRCSPRSNTLRGSPEMSKGLLLDMIARLQLAVEGPMPKRRRFLRRQLLDHLCFAESERSEIGQEIDRRMRPFQDGVIRAAHHSSSRPSDPLGNPVRGRMGHE